MTKEKEQKDKEAKERVWALYESLYDMEIETLEALKNMINATIVQKKGKEVVKELWFKTKNEE